VQKVFKLIKILDMKELQSNMDCPFYGPRLKCNFFHIFCQVACAHISDHVGNCITDACNSHS